MDSIQVISLSNEGINYIVTKENISEIVMVIQCKESLVKRIGTVFAYNLSNN